LLPFIFKYVCIFLLGGGGGFGGGAGRGGAGGAPGGAGGPGNIYTYLSLE